MDTNFQSKKTEIANKLNEKAPNLKCPACGQTDFILTDGYFAHDLQENLVSRQIGGKSVPIVPVACKNCGFIMEFSVGILGLLPNNENTEK